MKLHALMASAVALTLAFTAPAKADSAEQEFVALLVILYGVSNNCPSYDFIQDGAKIAADKQGVDYDTFALASLNAIMVLEGEEYDRSKLIPAVTRQVRANRTDLSELLHRSRHAFCKRFGKITTDTGFMEEKSNAR